MQTSEPMSDFRLRLDRNPGKRSLGLGPRMCAPRQHIVVTIIPMLPRSHAMVGVTTGNYSPWLRVENRFTVVPWRSTGALGIGQGSPNTNCGAHKVVPARQLRRATDTGDAGRVQNFRRSTVRNDSRASLLFGGSRWAGARLRVVAKAARWLRGRRATVDA